MFRFGTYAAEERPMPCSFRVAYALLGIAGLIVSAGTPAAARVGVTSATDGDPTGKPPTAAERILRVGIDVVADELITTRGDDRAHLIFLDGTSLTVSPNAQLKIDRFVYDPASQSGEIGITATKGVFRLVGGKISKSSAITVQTPSATLGLRGGIGIFSVEPGETTARFLFGKSLAVTAGGRTEIASRAGSEIRSLLGGVPGLPSAIGQGALSQSLQLLEAPRRTGGNASIDEAAKRSGFSAQNSGRSPSVNAADAARIDALANTISSIVAQARPMAATPIVTTGPAAASIAAPPPVIASQPFCPDVSQPHHHHHYGRR
jgi:hypothetical protein